MVPTETLSLVGNAAAQPLPAVTVDREFDARWAAWVARGQVHERRARRKAVIAAGVFAIGAMAFYTFFK